MRTRRPWTVTAMIALTVSALVTGQAISTAAASALPLPATAASAPLQVLTIGDSIMRGHGLSETQAWPSLLATSEGWALTNAACDGAGVLSIGSASQCTGNYDGIIGAVSGLQPDIIIFEGSSNDFGQDPAALLTATISELRTIRSDFPNAEIVGLSTLWGYSDVPAQIAQINAQVQQAVTLVGGTYVDIGQPMQGHPELMQAGDVHPNSDGQAVLASEIHADIESTAKDALARVRINSARVARVDALLRVKRIL